MIYLDNAATTRVRPEVIEAMIPYFSEAYGNPSSVYTLGKSARKAVERAREYVAALIGAEGAEEIFFTGGGSEANNWAITGGTAGKAGRHIITSGIEHHSVLRSTAYLEKRGYRVTYLPVDSYGRIDINDVEEAICEDTVLISIMGANNEIGTLQPVTEIGRLAEKYGIPFHSDAVQAAGHIEIDVKHEGERLLSLSGHKFYAPKGVGALYIKKGTHITPLIRGGGQEKNMRAGTENVAGIVGMGEAARLALSELEIQSAQQTALRDHMINRILNEIKGSSLNGDPIMRLPGNVSINLEKTMMEDAVFMLDSCGIACSSGSACTAGSHTPSHVIAAIRAEADMPASTLRFSLSRDTTRGEIDAVVDVLKRI